MEKKQQHEPNPFAHAEGAEEWARIIEHETGTVRVDIIPTMVSTWIEEIEPKVVVDLGSGQGALAHHVQGNVEYIGVEPSVHLTARAKEINSRKGRQFIVGNAYAIPLGSGTSDAVVSINVWFHLEDLDTASRELSRILREGGKFMICTTNPEAYDLWLSMFENPDVDDRKIDGKLNLPGAFGFTRNIVFKHSMQEIRGAFAKHGLVVDRTEFPKMSESERPLFVTFFGRKT